MACNGQFNKPIDTKTMNTELINSITQYVEKHIGEFHANRIAKLQFRTARRVFNTSRKTVPTMCIEGCCYGNDNKGYNDSDHEKYCGEKFWTLISGEPTLFVDIIEPLGSKAKEKNEAYFIEYSRMINKFTQEFVQNYCNANGDIEWEKIVRLNAAIKVSKTSKKE